MKHPLADQIIRRRLADVALELLLQVTGAHIEAHAQLLQRMLLRIVIHQIDADLADGLRQIAGLAMIHGRQQALRQKPRQKLCRA